MGIMSIASSILYREMFQLRFSNSFATFCFNWKLNYRLKSNLCDTNVCVLSALRPGVAHSKSPINLIDSIAKRLMWFLSILALSRSIISVKLSDSVNGWIAWVDTIWINNIKIRDTHAYMCACASVIFANRDFSRSLVIIESSSFC